MNLDNDPTKPAETEDQQGATEISPDQLDEANGGWIPYAVAAVASAAVGVYRGYRSGK